MDCIVHGGEKSDSLVILTYPNPIFIKEAV